MQQNILYIAYHFPPIAESSGVLRTLSYIRALQLSGYSITVLTVSENALKKVRDENLQMVPLGVNVIRCKAWDWAQLVFLKGKYPGFLAIPDRYSSWLISGYIQGIKAMKELSPVAIVSTSPMPTAHMLGHLLSVKMDTPWITDFRDPLAQNDYPNNKLQRKVHWWLEGKTVKKSVLRVFATESARREHLTHFSNSDPQQSCVLENGFDEHFFSERERIPSQTGPLRFYHSGSISLEERDPTAFIEALGACKSNSIWPDRGVEVIFRCSESLDWMKDLVEKLSLQDCVHILPVVEYKRAIKEFELAHGLLLFQGSNCDQQIPAKAYEYVRAKRPVLTLCGKQGATADLMHSLNVGPVVEIDDKRQIICALEWAFESAKDWQTPLSRDMIAAFSRENKAKCFADKVTGLLGTMNGN